MKNKILIIGALLLIAVSTSIASDRSPAENQCRDVCNEQRNTCREKCFYDHKDDSTYIGMNQCQNECNPISNKCKDTCEDK